MRNQKNRAKIATTISPDDKSFLEFAGLNASTALSIGVTVLRNAIRAPGPLPVVGMRRLADLAMAESPAAKVHGHPPLFATIEEYQAAKKRVEEAGWKSAEDVREYFAGDMSNRNAVEEARDEEAQDIP